jgi:hypothetical protein
MVNIYLQQQKHTALNTITKKSAKSGLSQKYLAQIRLFLFSAALANIRFGLAETF